MPLTDDGVRYGDPKAQEARYAAFWPMELLYALLRAGSLDGSALRVDGEALRAIRFKRTAGLLEAWRAQGFVFAGLKNGRFDPAVGLTVTCPSDGDVLPTLYAVARKAARIGCGGERFREWNYRLLLDGADEYRYGDAYFVLYDKLHTQADRAFVEAFHPIAARARVRSRLRRCERGAGACAITPRRPSATAARPVRSASFPTRGRCFCSFACVRRTRAPTTLPAVPRR